MSFLLRLCLGLLILVPSLAHAATLENPGDQTYSGIGVISGSEAEGAITVRFDDDERLTVAMVYGSERGDTRGVCGDTNNGFLAIFNWALLGAMETHTAVAYDNGVEFDRSTFEVGTLGEEFVTGSGVPRCEWRISRRQGRAPCWSGMRAANTSRSSPESPSKGASLRQTKPRLIG